MRKPVIYQLLPRLFGNRRTDGRTWGTVEENGVGKFADINEAALNSIRALGATHVWYTGVLEHATVTDYSEFNIPGDFAEVVKGRAGSPYAIRDYYDVAPDLALYVPDRMSEFEALVARTHAGGLKVIIDFVPNHVARRYHSDAKPPGTEDLGAADDTTVHFHPRNNFYYLPGQPFVPPRDYRPLGGSASPRAGSYREFPAKISGSQEFSASPGVEAWFETVKLNYGVDLRTGDTHFDPVPDTWNKMRDILMFWMTKQVDGFRCDMAEMVPVEFWAWVIPQIRTIKSDVLFIAEIYRPDLYRAYVEKGGFDYLYDKVHLYDSLRMIVSRQQGIQTISRIQKELAGLGKHLVHFLENHDEQRIASRHFAGNAWCAVPAMVVSATIDKGAIMIYFGQEVGEPAEGDSGFSGDDGRTTLFDYWRVPHHQLWMNEGRFDEVLLSDDQRRLRRFYGELLHLASHHPAIVDGEYDELNVTYRMDTGNSVHAFVRYKGVERLAVVSNFSDDEMEVDIGFPTDLCMRIGLRRGSGVLRGIFGTDRVYRMEDERFTLSIARRAGVVFRIEE